MTTQTAPSSRRSAGESLFGAIHLFLYNLTGGRVGGVVMGQKIVVMNVVGRRTGKVRPTPVVCAEIEGQLYVAASHGGAPVSPAWFFNLRDRPNITVVLDGKTRPVTAEVLDEPERSRIWALMCEKVAIFVATQKRTTRVIPVVRLGMEQAS